MEAEAERKRREEAAQGGGGSSSSGTTQVGNYTYPLPSGYRTVSSRFGYRNHPVTGRYKLHTGVDISAPNGTPIYAAQPGTAIIAGYSSAWGNYVVINHGNGITTLYAHMSKILTTKGATVSAGQQIGKVGSTGYSTGNHLHFSVRKDGAYTSWACIKQQIIARRSPVHEEKIHPGFHPDAPDAGGGDHLQYHLLCGFGVL